MANTTLIVGIVVFILLVVFTVAVFIGYGIADKPQNSVSIATVQNGFFLDNCSTTPCQSGLTCDGVNFTCRLSQGTSCTNSTDCVSGLFCSGLCTSGPTGGLGQLCPCNSGLSCVQQLSGLTVCKGNGGASCTQNSDCASDVCNSGVCASGSPNSFPCTTDAMCESDNCSNGFCQSPGVISGTQGSSCADACLPITGSVCNSGLICVCNQGTGNPGTCATDNQGIISGCSISSTCVPNLVCLNSSGTECTTTTGCTCYFSYDNPNVPDSGVQCIPGLTLVNGTCLNSTGLGCDSNTQCSSNNCGSPSVVVRYTFATTSVSDMGTAFPSATSTTLEPTFNGPTGTVSPHKIFAVSNGAVDTLYLVDNNLGFLSLQYNTSSNTIVQDWTILIPHQITQTGGTGTTTQVLIDVGTNAQQDFLVAFLETLTSGSQVRTNYTVYSWDGTTFTVFNPQPSKSGLPGTQYNSSGTPLSISYIHISSSNQVQTGGDVLISFNGTIYVKPASSPSYSVGIVQGGPHDNASMTGVTGPAYFYYDTEENSGATGPVVCPEQPGGSNPINCPPVINISFVAPFVSYQGSVMLNALQFSGNIAGTAQPNDVFTTGEDVQYQVFDYSIYSSTTGNPPGMQGAAIIMLAAASVHNTPIGNVVALNYGGAGAIFPYQIGPDFRAAASANAYYIISPSSCN